MERRRLISPTAATTRQPRQYLLKNINTSIKTLVAMSKFKQKISSMGDQATKSVTPKEKVGRKKKIKEVTKTKERALKHTNFSNLIDRRPKRRKDRIPIVTMKTIREIEILPTWIFQDRFHTNTHDITFSLQTLLILSSVHHSLLIKHKIFDNYLTTKAFGANASSSLQTY